MNTLIIWDWNGTLLDDVDVAISIMNILLKKRNLPLLTKRRYKRVFTFPIKEYYRSLGFNFEKEPFEMLAVEFIEKYLRSYNKFKLKICAKKILSYLSRKGYKQIIISATNKSNLSEQIELFGIEKYFSEIIGIDDHYGKSKKDHAMDIIKKYKNEYRVIMIGDTLHDKEVADAIGCECILVADGHQQKEILSRSRIKVIDELSEIINLF